MPARLVLDDKAITDVAVDAGALQALFTALEPDSGEIAAKKTEEPREMEMDAEPEIEEPPQNLHFREVNYDSRVLGPANTTTGSFYMSG